MPRIQFVKTQPVDSNRAAKRKVRTQDEKNSKKEDIIRVEDLGIKIQVDRLKQLFQEAVNSTNEEEALDKLCYVFNAGMGDNTTNPEAAGKIALQAHGLLQSTFMGKYYCDVNGKRQPLHSAARAVQEAFNILYQHGYRVDTDFNETTQQCTIRHSGNMMERKASFDSIIRFAFSLRQS